VLSRRFNDRDCLIRLPVDSDGMPELPEVETVRRGLLRLLGSDAAIVRVQARRADLRWILPDFSVCAGLPIRSIQRRGKYLLWHLGDVVLLNHLGMSGSWRELIGAAQTHDHVLLQLRDGRVLAYRDPRRFGMLDVVSVDAIDRHPRLVGLGPDPLDPAWTAADLQRGLRGRRSAIKALLLDQRQVAGIGNIYAVEACFRAGIRPRRAAGRLRQAEIVALHAAIQAILQEAISAGGSTTRDFVQAGGSSGYFQHAFQVYGRARLNCLRCGSQLRDTPVAGRQTVWCPGCQK
jgi:formamidopyrimidine-DNA glycosylase